MKRALTVAGLLVVGIALTTPLVFTQRGTMPIDPGTFTHPDLAVEKIVLTEWLPTGGGSEITVVVDVRNIGTKSAPPCNVMVNWCQDAGASKPVETWVERMDDGLAPGEAEAVFFEMEVNWQSVAPLQGMLIAIVDPPVSGKPTGEIHEWAPLLSVPGKKPARSETNNVFGVIFDMGHGNLPIRWDNPVMQ